LINLGFDSQSGFLNLIKTPMRPRLDPARDRLLTTLCRLGPSTATALSRALGVSAASPLRFLHEAGDAVVHGGRARSRRYAARRPLRKPSSPGARARAVQLQRQPYARGLAY